MFHKHLLPLLLVPCSLVMFQPAANALPGQTTEDVSAWIKAHPTLRPRSGEKLLVTKSDTAAQRFIFQASVLPPGRVAFTEDRSKIRTERLAIFDAVNGITQQRLQESLRIIYGLDIYQDFERARVAYEYPSESAINEARSAKTPIREALQGQLRIGDRFAYWWEIAKPPEGKAINGQITVLLLSDVNKLESELRNR
jgi:hypothetical protein